MDTKLYISVITLLTQDNVILLKQLESGFKRSINWNKYQSKITDLAQNKYLDFLIDPDFQGLNMFFYYHLKVRMFEKVTSNIFDIFVMIDERNFFDQSVKNNLRTNDSIRTIATGQGDDYTTGCLLDYQYFKEYYKLIAIDLSKQQKLNADPKAMQQINFTGNLERDGDTRIFFSFEEAKETVLDFSKKTKNNNKKKH